jgi:PIN domain nuclease of toxin-antitoxin system
VAAARDEFLGQAGARELAIQSEHALYAADLPPLHRDPFDRLLIAQAQLEQLTLVTADDSIRRYGLPLQWAT